MARSTSAYRPHFREVTQPSSFQRLMQFLNSKAVIAFIMCLPLLIIIVGLVIYPFGYAIYLSMLNKAETEFVGLDNFFFLINRNTFWMVFQQSIVFALTAVFFKALLGFIAAHLIHNVHPRGQRIWRGLALVPWVIPPALSTLGWWWLFDPTHSAVNWLLAEFGGPHIPWLSDVFWARFSIILVNIWYGAPFFLIMYLAALKSIPEELYDAAKVDGASPGQRLRHITFPMMRNIISITMLFSIIVTLANFDIARILTQGGPRNTTHLFGTYAFKLGIEGGDVPLGAAVSLFMFPILAVLAIFILRDVRQRAARL